MNKSFHGILLLLCVAFSSVNGFSVAAPRAGGGNGGSSFVVAQRFTVQQANVTPRRGDMNMVKVAKFGVFSPGVYAGKIVLGEKKFLKIRGKIISAHSGIIKDWCKWSGAGHLSTKIISFAKDNGNILGFLV